MARPSRLTQLSSVALLCFVFASAGYMMYLVYSQYQAQEKLQKSFLQRSLQESEKKALSVGYFLSERVYDLSTIAENRLLSLYYENRALGMSLEYGLGASINGARDMLARFRQSRVIDGKPIFSKILYAEASGKVLFESRDHGTFPKVQNRVPQNMARRTKAAEFLSERVDGEEYLVISYPFLFKDRYMGRLSGWIPVSLICLHFVASVGDNDTWRSILVLKNNYLFCKNLTSPDLTVESLPAVETIRPGVMHTISLPASGNLPPRTQVFATPVANSPISLMSFHRADSHGAGKPPHALFFILGGIGLALLVGGIAFYRASMRSAVLEARLEETRLRERIVEEKNRSLRKLLTALEQSCYSVMITDVNGIIEYVNPHFTRVTGYSLDEVLGKNPRFLKSGHEPYEKYREMWETVLKGKNWFGEFLNRKKNGELFWEHENIAPVFDEQGAISSLIAIKEDTTERKRAEHELRTAKEAAEAASRAKSMFLANVSHEIRTPLNGVMGMTELCLATKLDEKQRLYLATARASAQNLLEIINDILDFSKIEAGKAEVDRSPFLLRTLVGQTLRPLAAKAAEKGIDILFAPTAETPDALIGDPGKLKQVLVNLVGNAIKFTEKGCIIVGVSAENSDAKEYLLTFFVQDSGIGISPECREKIFDSFEQGDVSTTKVYEGTGLGLAISKKLVELMDGFITVTSELGVGSTFTFTARFAPGDTSMLPGVPEILGGRRALVLDPTNISRRVLCDYLAQMGILACQAENAAQAHEILRQIANDSSRLDFLLVDERIPDADAFTFINEIRGNPDFKSLYCILMPAVSSLNAAGENPEMSIDGYLPKPVFDSELCELLCAVVSDDSRNRVEETPDIRDSLVEKKDRLSILVAEDVPVNQELMETILDSYGHKATLVDTGEKAVETWWSAEDSFDLILMDVQMPEMDGLAATRMIRELEKKRCTHVPIVAMTAYAMQSDKDMCLSAGMDGYISKPFRLDEIGALLERYSHLSGVV